MKNPTQDDTRHLTSSFTVNTKPPSKCRLYASRLCILITLIQLVAITQTIHSHKNTNKFSLYLGIGIIFSSLISARLYCHPSKHTPADEDQDTYYDLESSATGSKPRNTLMSPSFKYGAELSIAGILSQYGNNQNHSTQQSLRKPIM